MKRLRITVEGVAYEVTVEELDGPAAPPRQAPWPPAARPLGPPRRRPWPRRQGPARRCRAHLAGTVVSVAVAPGQQVAAGAELLILEAMKMNTTIGAPQAARSPPSM